ncbi:MAG: PTS sugar transporter subunit IIA [Desulfovibrio sp.]|jgi:PTS system mannose-specific IIA component|nr:PTS sugar transporter subunit IIA [Desulfovibrio sp.]
MTSLQTDIRQVGIIVVTHADYGSALLRAAEYIAGPAQDCAFIQVDATLEVTDTVNRLKEAASRLDNGQGVLVLTDMFGGTPTNLSLSLLGARSDVEVLTGVNLPMLLKVLDNRQMPLTELAESARKAGCEGIIAAGTVLRAKNDSRREGNTDSSK